MSEHRLSKSRYCAGLQCLKQLWWRVHEPEAPELEPGPALGATFDRGTRVGELARAEFPSGVLVASDPWDIRRNLERTATLLPSGAPAIFEASFESAGVFEHLPIPGHPVRDPLSDGWIATPDDLERLGGRIPEARHAGLRRCPTCKELRGEWLALDGGGTRSRSGSR